MMTRLTIPRAALIAAALMVVACGSSLDKGPKKVASNNTSSNNTTSNNTTANNTTANNTTANNTTANNTTANNSMPCVSVAPASLNFGEVRVGEVVQAVVTVSNCSNDVSMTLDGATAPLGFDVLLGATTQLAPQTTANVTVEFSPTAETGFVGQATIETSAGSAVVNVQGAGIIVESTCPTAVARGRAKAADPWTSNVIALTETTVELTGMDSTASSAITGYQWSIVTRPAGSTARLTPAADVVNPSLFVDLPGRYEVDLAVTTADSPANCPAARIRIDASGVADPNEISIQLVWNTPGDADQTDSIGADLDLHYMHPSGTWNMAPYDCYYANKTANWGADGTATVDIDDLDGLGPENINHINAGALSYKIGVHYFNDNGYGPSTATVTVRRGSVQIYQKNDFSLSNDQFWYVGDLNAANDTFAPNDTVTAGLP